MNRKIQTVAIIGGGPVASTLATQLIRQGIKVSIFYVPKPNPLIVGESLVPAIIPILRDLGLEDEVKEIGKLKPGACFNVGPDVSFAFCFTSLRNHVPNYAYQVPRDKFDAILLQGARRAGANIFEIQAVLEKVEGTDRVRLSQATLDATQGVLSGQPDLIVDATGRLRLIPKLLGIGAQTGKRQDTALFAHVDQTKIDHEGYTHTTRIESGWSWRIPLPDRMSLGIVMPAGNVSKYGSSKEEQYDNILKQDKVMREFASTSKRLTPVVQHNNYSLVSDRMHGDGWVLVGDTAGFIDPVFSSGLFLGMNGANNLADAIQQGTPEAIREYADHYREHLQTWLRIVSYYYEGHLFACFKTGQQYLNTAFGRMIYPHMDTHMGRIFAGTAALVPYSRWLLHSSMAMTARRSPKLLAEMAVN